MPEKTAEELLPLTPLWFNILLCAAEGPTHQSAVAKEIEERTGGTLSPGTGTVYVALQRLIQEGLLHHHRGAIRKNGRDRGPERSRSSRLGPRPTWS